MWILKGGGCMLFIRRGPLIMFFKSNQPERLKGCFENVGGLHITEGLEKEMNNKERNLCVSNETELELKGLICAAMESAGEADTIAVIHSSKMEKCNLTNAHHIFLINKTPANLLAKLINEKSGHLIDEVKSGPSPLVMRVPSCEGNVINQIRESYSGVKLSIPEALEMESSNSTIVFFSIKSIDRVLPLKDVHSNVIVIDRPPLEIYRDIRKNAVRYFTNGLENTSWFELKLNIYDSNEQYDLHLKRLYLLLTDLELGFVLSEEWTRDQAFVLLSVTAYQIKLFTMTPPKELKKILIGLEYNEQGERLVDIDLYYRNKKIERNNLEEMRKMGKEKGGIMFRKEMINKLSPQALEKLISLEKQIDK